jgi:murein DD-endopeptidase MepM/ murein hydrolase activator NlpD
VLARLPMGCEAGREAIMSSERSNTEAEIEEAFGALSSDGMIEIRAAHVEAPAASLAFARRTPHAGNEVPMRTGTCPTCNGPVDVKSRHIAVHQGAVRVYCSPNCLEMREAPHPEVTIELAIPRKRHKIWWALLGLFVAGGTGTAFYLNRELREMNDYTPPAPAIAAIQPPADPPTHAVNDPQKEADTALVNELMHDAWIHPLAGPTRRMPVNHNGAFGADRGGGERPPECVSGHCGVDVGNVWGERVFAVHDGVIDFVNRGPNEERGGAFVRISHRDGTLFSWYFHLAAIPKSIRPGVKVTAGTVVGLLGDTGIKHSSPHLHFALSVKTSKNGRERYLDPEPLIAIWPLWLPKENMVGGTLLESEPGLPVRASGPAKPKARKPANDESAAPSTATAPSITPPAQPGSSEAATGTAN